jgi:hypothetical protein
MSHHKALATTAALATLCATVVAATPAQAQGGRTVRASGTCSNGPGSWALKAKADDGRLAVEFEVDTNRTGQRWHVRITDNGHLVASRFATTLAPSGSFTVHVRTANRAGTDHVRATATRGDRTCTGAVRF